MTALACGKTVPIGSDHASELAGSSSDGGGADVGPPTANDEDDPLPDDGAVACPYGLPKDAPTAPTRTYHRHCSSNADCAIVRHATDCCGNSIALGAATAEVARFKASICAPDDTGPQCGCPAAAPVAEDGQRAPTLNAAEISVACSDHVCRTYVMKAFPCGSAVCASVGEYCEGLTAGIPAPDGGTSPTTYTCKPVPPACVATPDCACIASGLSSSTCDDSDGHVMLSRMGI